MTLFVNMATMYSVHYFWRNSLLFCHFFDFSISIFPRSPLTRTTWFQLSLVKIEIWIISPHFAMLCVCIYLMILSSDYFEVIKLILNSEICFPRGNYLLGGLFVDNFRNVHETADELNSDWHSDTDNIIWQTSTYMWIWWRFLKKKNMKWSD